MSHSVIDSVAPTREEYYREAFSRNLGILTQAEQKRLKDARVAVAGLGGMGGVDFLSLVRLGIGHFNIADLDTFSAVNSNRQVGANQRSLGRPKIEVMGELAKDISPEIDIRYFPQGFTEARADEFLRDADIVVDAIDFFCLSARELLYKKAREHGKTVLFSAPLGFSATLHVFTPTSMPFEKYFDFQPGMDAFDKLVAFAVGLAPAALHTRYLHFDAEKLAQGIGSSMGSACNLGSAFLVTELANILLARRQAFETPNYLQVDPFLLKLKKGKLRFGNRGPLQLLKRWLVAKRYSNLRGRISGVVK